MWYKILFLVPYMIISALYEWKSRKIVKDEMGKFWGSILLDVIWWLPVAVYMFHEKNLPDSTYQDERYSR